MNAILLQVPEVCPYEADIVVTLEVTDVLDGGVVFGGSIIRNALLE